MKFFERFRSRRDGPPSVSAPLAEVINGELPSWRSRLAATPTSRLPSFERRMRSEMPWWLNEYGLTPKRLKQLFIDVEDATTLAQLASVHRNGFLREAAVKRLAHAAPIEQSLRWLLLRCVDWVPEVSSAAVASVAKLAAESDAKANSYLADGVTLWAVDPKEKQVGELFSSLAARLLEASNVELLVQVAQGSDLGAARKATELLLAVMPPLDLLTIARRDDAVSARMIFRIAIEDPASCEVAAASFVDSRYPNLRAEALWHLVNHDHGVPSMLVERGLTDRSSLVRDVAQRYSAAHGQDVRHFYLERLAIDAGSALAGLGDLGSPDDLQTALPFVDSSSVSVRQAALRIVATCGQVDSIPLLVDHAVFDSGAPARQAIRGLRRLGIRSEVAGEYWSQLLKADSESAYRRFFRQVLPSASRWIGLEFALRGCEMGNPAVREMAAECVLSIVDRVGESHLAPEPARLPTLKHALSVATPLLPPTVVEELTDVIARAGTTRPKP